MFDINKQICSAASWYTLIFHEFDFYQVPPPYVECIIDLGKVTVKDLQYNCDVKIAGGKAVKFEIIF